MLNNLNYHWAVFRLTWLNWNSIINRLDTTLWQPVAIELYNRGIIKTKPWLLVARSYIRKDIDN